jgi:hypothetical protein
VRARVSPHFDILPLRSISPDGIVTLIRSGGSLGDRRD